MTPSQSEGAKVGMDAEGRVIFFHFTTDLSVLRHAVSFKNEWSMHDTSREAGFISVKVDIAKKRCYNRILMQKNIDI